MRKFLLGALLLLSMTSFGQEYKIEEKSVTCVFDVPGKTKAEIFSFISKWISINYNSGRTVTQLSDPEGGNIVVKGINEVHYYNNTKILYPNNNSLPETSIIKFNHLIEINIKDNKYRIVYRLIDIHYEPSAKEYLTPEIIEMNWLLIKLTGITDSELKSLGEWSETMLKKGLVGKEKREKYIQGLKPMYDKLNLAIVDDMKTTMLSINKSVTLTSDGW